MDAFVEELELLINKSVQYSILAEENRELKKRIEVLEADQKYLVATKATEYNKEVELEVMVRLAKQLAPFFGFTMGENFERMVRQFLESRDNPALSSLRRIIG